MRSLSLAVSSLVFSGCFLFGNGNNNKDPLEKVTMRVTTYLTNTSTSLPTELTGTSAESWSNRPVDWGLNNYTDKIVRYEVKKKINGVETSCDLVDQDGKPLIYTGYLDWAGVSTQYTMTVYTDSSSKTFGPYDITVKPADIVLHSNEELGDQGYDSPASSGPFFQTKSVDIGFGGYQGANFDSILAGEHPRQINFAFLTEGGELKAVSPDLIKTIYDSAELKNDCGYLTTTFAVYTGTVDPELSTSNMTIAEVRALPDPPAGATKLTLSTGTTFIYKTSEGLKGLVKIKSITGTGTAPKMISIFYFAEQ